MSYSEFSPPPELAQHVRLIWQFEATATACGNDELQPVQRIVPDGHAELILHFGDPYAEVDAYGNTVIQAHALFAGQLTRPLLLRAGQHAGVIGIRFRPAAARAFLGVPMQELTDRRVALTELWGESALRLVQALKATRDSTARTNVVAAVLTDRLATTLTPTDTGIARCAEILLARDVPALRRHRRALRARSTRGRRTRDVSSSQGSLRRACRGHPASLVPSHHRGAGDRRGDGRRAPRRT